MRNSWPVVLLFSAAIACPTRSDAQDANQAGAPKAIAVEVAVGTAVADRQLTGTADAFPTSAGTLYCYMKIANATDAQIEHVWYRGNLEMRRMKLNVGGSPWRTWSSKKIGPEAKGDWRCDVVQDGKVLGSVKFSVE